MIDADPDCARELKSVIEKLHDELALIERRVWRGRQKLKKFPPGAPTTGVWRR
jgi:hypothetical protein